MAHSTAIPDFPRTGLVIPTAHETALFLLTPDREIPARLLKEWHEEENLTNDRYYSATSD
jgi:hypothetical protein